MGLNDICEKWGNDNTDNAHNEPSYVSKRLPFAHVREMQCNRDEGFEIEFGVIVCELKGTATVEAMTTALQNKTKNQYFDTNTCELHK